MGPPPRLIHGCSWAATPAPPEPPSPHFALLRAARAARVNDPKEDHRLMDTSPSILLADEDSVTRAFLADNLIADGYDVLVAQDRAAALDALRTHQPDLVICDINGDSLGLLDAVRRADGLASRMDPDTPLIILSADADALARLRYWERGSDDVVAKPLSYPELRARIRVLLRRARGHGAGPLRVGALRIDHAAREVHVGARRVELSAMEFALLRALAIAPARVHTKQELLRDVWGFRSEGRTRTVDSHACRLRTKLRAAGAPTLIENVWGVGYRLYASAGPPAPDDHAA